MLLLVIIYSFVNETIKSISINHKLFSLIIVLRLAYFSHQVLKLSINDWHDSFKCISQNVR